MKQAKNLRGMFKDCNNLRVLPAISQWNVENVESMEEMFSGCKNLRIRTFPDLKTWNLKKLKNIDKMFFGCGFASKFQENYEREPQIEDFLKINNKEMISCENIFDSD